MKEFFINGYISLKKSKPLDFLDLYALYLFPVLIVIFCLGYLVISVELLKQKNIVIDQFFAGLFFFFGWIFFPLMTSIYTRSINSRKISMMLFMSIGLYSTFLNTLLLYFLWLFIILFIDTEPYKKISKMQFFIPVKLIYSKLFPEL
jgi:hypothetical protein